MKRFAALAPALFPCLALAQVAILQIRITEGDGAVHQAGARAARPLAVEVTEETGRPAAAAAVSFHLPDEGPGGTFTNGLRTEVLIADPAGRVVLRGLHLNRAPGRFQIRIYAQKEQARAGTVSFQYISDLGDNKPAAAAARTGRPPAAAGAHSRKLWVLAAAAGAAVAGGVAATRGSAAVPRGPAPAAIAAPPPVTLSIGPPTVTVVKP